MSADIENFIKAYKVCALWSSNDNADATGGEPLDRNYDVEDFSEETQAQMRADCEKFIQENVAMLEWKGDYFQHGHDFWLTRNHHGAGFWDRGYPEEMGKSLTDAAHAFGECDLIVGEDGEIHLM